MSSYYNKVRGTLNVGELAQSSDIHLIQDSIQTAIKSLIVDMFGPGYILGENETDLSLIPTPVHNDQFNTNFNESNNWISFYERYFRQGLYIDKSAIESVKVQMMNNSNLTVTVYAEIRDTDFNFIQEANAVLEPSGSIDNEVNFSEIEFNFNLTHMPVGHYYFVIKPVDIFIADLSINGDENEYDNISPDMFQIRYDRGGNYNQALEASYNGSEYLEARKLEDAMTTNDNGDLYIEDNNFDLYFEEVFSSGITYLVTPGAAVVLGEKVYPLDTHIVINGPSTEGNRTDLVTLTQDGKLNVIKGKIWTGVPQYPEDDSGFKIAYITSYQSTSSQWVCPNCGYINKINMGNCTLCGTTVNEKIPLVEQADDNGITRHRDVLERIRRLEKKIDYQMEYNSPTRIKYMCTLDPIIAQNNDRRKTNDVDLEGTYGTSIIKNENGENVAVPNTGSKVIQKAWSFIKRNYSQSYTKTTKYNAQMTAWDLDIPYTKPKTLSDDDYYRIRIINPNKHSSTSTSKTTIDSSGTSKTTTTTVTNLGVEGVEVTLTLKSGTNTIMSKTYKTNSKGWIKFNMYSWLNKEGNATGGLSAGKYTMYAKYGSSKTIKNTITVHAGNFNAGTPKETTIQIPIETSENRQKTYSVSSDVIAGDDSFGKSNVTLNVDTGEVKLAKVKNSDDKYISTTPLKDSKTFSTSTQSYKVNNNTKSLTSEYPVLNLTFDRDCYVRSLTPYIDTFENMSHFKIILFRNDEVFNLTKTTRVSYQKKFKDDPTFPNIYESEWIALKDISKTSNGKKILKKYQKFTINQEIPAGTYSLLVCGKLEQGKSEGAIYIKEYNTMEKTNEYGVSTKCLGSCNPSVIYLETNNITSRSWDLVIEKRNDVYKESGTLISKPISEDFAGNIEAVTVSKNTSIPSGCSLKIYVSNNGGQDYINADSGHVTFNGVGNIFRWKAVLYSNGTHTPVLKFNADRGYGIRFNIATKENYVAYEDYQRCLETPLMDANFITSRNIMNENLTRNFSEWEFARIWAEAEEAQTDIDICISYAKDTLISSSWHKDAWSRSIFFSQIFANLTLEDFERISVDYDNYEGNLERDEYNYRFKYQTDYNYNWSADSSMIIASGEDAGNINYEDVDISNFQWLPADTTIPYTYYGNEQTTGEGQELYAGMHIQNAPYGGVTYVPDIENDGVSYYNSEYDETYDERAIIVGVRFDDGFNFTDNYTGMNIWLYCELKGEDRPTNEDGKQYLPAGTLEAVVSLNPYGLIDEEDASYGKAYPIGKDLVSGEFTKVSLPIVEDIYALNSIYSIGIRVKDIEIERDEETGKEKTTTLRAKTDENDIIGIVDIGMSGNNIRQYIQGVQLANWKKTANAQNSKLFFQYKASSYLIQYDLYGKTAKAYKYTDGYPYTTLTPHNSTVNSVIIKDDTIATKMTLSNGTIQNPDYRGFWDCTAVFEMNPSDTGILYAINANSSINLTPYDLIAVQYYVEEVFNTSSASADTYKTTGNTDVNEYTTVGGTSGYRTTMGQFGKGEIYIKLYDEKFDFENGKPRGNCIASMPLPAWGRVQTRSNVVNKKVTAWYKKRNNGNVKAIVVERQNPEKATLYKVKLHLERITFYNPDSMPALGPQLQMRIYPNNIDNLTNTKIRKFGVIYRIS